MKAALRIVLPGCVFLGVVGGQVEISVVALLFLWAVEVFLPCPTTT